MYLKKTICLLIFISLLQFVFSEDSKSQEFTDEKPQQIELEDLLTETNLDEETLKQELMDEAKLNNDEKNSRNQFENKNLTENENLSENQELSENEENNNQKIIQKIPLSFITEEMLARPEVEKFRRQYLN